MSLIKKTDFVLFSGFHAAPLFYNFLIDLLADLNINLYELEKHTKFKIEKIEKEVPFLKFYILWKSIEKVTGKSDIGLIIADHFTPSKAGIIGELFLGSENLRVSVDIMKRFLYIILNNIYLRYEESGEYAYFYFDIAPKFLISHSMLECYIKICNNWAEEYTGLKALPIVEMDFYYKKPEHFVFYKKHFPNTKIFFDKQNNCVILQKDIFYLKNRRKTKTPYSYIIRHAEQIKKEIGLKYTFSQKVINHILMALPEGKNSIEQISENLNISISTLKRKLKNENTNFTHLNELVKKKLAFILVSSTDHSYEEIAYLLGYSEYSSFFRAFKKWFDFTPSNIRGKQQN